MLYIKNCNFSFKLPKFFFCLKLNEKQCAVKNVNPVLITHVSIVVEYAVRSSNIRVLINNNHPELQILLSRTRTNKQSEIKLTLSELQREKDVEDNNKMKS